MTTTTALSLTLLLFWFVGFETRGGWVFIFGFGFWGLDFGGTRGREVEGLGAEMRGGRGKGWRRRVGNGGEGKRMAMGMGYIIYQSRSSYQVNDQNLKAVERKHEHEDVLGQAGLGQGRDCAMLGSWECGVRG